MEQLNIKYKPIKELKPYKKNAKKHNKEQVEQIANSIKEFGFTQPVIIDKNNCVVAGHGRILGAKKAGLKQVPTVMLEDLSTHFRVLILLYKYKIFYKNILTFCYVVL